eukprot:197510_1
MATHWLSKTKRLLQDKGNSTFDSESAEVCIGYLSHQSNDIAFAALDIIHFVCKSGGECMSWGNWDDNINFECFGKLQKIDNNCNLNVLHHVYAFMCRLKHDDISNVVKQQIDDIMNCGSRYYQYHARSTSTTILHQNQRTLLKIWTKLRMHYRSMHGKEVDIRSDSLERHVGTVLFGANSCYLRSKDGSIHRDCLYDTIATSSYASKHIICTGYIRLHLSINDIDSSLMSSIMRAIIQFYFLPNDIIKKLFEIYQSVHGIRDTCARKQVCVCFKELLHSEILDGNCDIAVDLMHHSIFDVFIDELKSIEYDEIQVDNDRFGYYNQYLLVHDGQEELETMNWLICHARFLTQFIDCGIIDIILNIIKKGIRGNFSDAALRCLYSLLSSANKAHVFTFVDVKFVRLLLNALVLFDVVHSSIDSSIMHQLHNILVNKQHRIRRIFRKNKTLKSIMKIKRRSTDSEMKVHCGAIVCMIEEWIRCSNAKCKTTWGKHRRGFKLCKRCQNTSYCSRKCQKYHWKHQHRAKCIQMLYL